MIRARKRYIVLRLYCTIGFHIALSLRFNISCFRRYSCVGGNRTFRARKRYVFICFYICGGRNDSLRRRRYVSGGGGYRAINCYAARFCFQRYVVFGDRGTSLFYSDIACIGSQVNCALCRRQVIVGGHIAISFRFNLSCFRSYSSVGRNNTSRARKFYISICFYICSSRNVLIRLRRYVSSCGGYRTVNSYAACFCFQRYIVLGGRFCFYSNTGCVRSQADRALCSRQSSIRSHIAISSCANASCY